MQFCQHKAMTTSSLKTLNTLYFCFARCTSQIEALTSPLGIPWVFDASSYPGGRAFDYHSQRVVQQLFQAYNFKWRGIQRLLSFPFRLFTNLLKCPKLLCSVAEIKLMIFLELGFIIFLLHVKIRERSLPYYQAFPFSIIAVDVHSGRRSG